MTQTPPPPQSPHRRAQPRLRLLARDDLRRDLRRAIKQRILVRSVQFVQPLLRCRKRLGAAGAESLGQLVDRRVQSVERRQMRRQPCGVSPPRHSSCPRRAASPGPARRRSCAPATARPPLGRCPDRPRDSRASPPGGSPRSRRRPSARSPRRPRRPAPGRWSESTVDAAVGRPARAFEASGPSPPGRCAPPSGPSRRRTIARRPRAPAPAPRDPTRRDPPLRQAQRSVPVKGRCERRGDSARRRRRRRRCGW